MKKATEITKEMLIEKYGEQDCRVAYHEVGHAIMLQVWSAAGPNLLAEQPFLKGVILNRDAEMDPKDSISGGCSAGWRRIKYIPIHEDDITDEIAKGYEDHRYIGEMVWTLGGGAGEIIFAEKINWLIWEDEGGTGNDVEMQYEARNTNYWYPVESAVQLFHYYTMNELMHAIAAIFIKPNMPLYLEMVERLLNKGEITRYKAEGYQLRVEELLGDKDNIIPFLVNVVEEIRVTWEGLLMNHRLNKIA